MRAEIRSAALAKRRPPVAIATPFATRAWQAQSMLRTLVIVVAGSLLAACGKNPGFEPTQNAVLERADTGELFSLDPSPPGEQPLTPAEDFRGYRILGKATLSKDERDRLIEASRAAIDSSNGEAAKCFNPRHGLRIVAQGDTVELVICFECQQMQIWQGASDSTVLIGTEGESEFEDAVSRHGLKTAGR